MRRGMRLYLAFGTLLLAVSAYACSSSSDADYAGSGARSGDAADGGEPVDTPRTLLEAHLPDPLANLPKGAEQLQNVCARGATNAVTRGLCSGPTLTSLRDLQAAIGLTFQKADAKGLNGQGGNPAFALLGNSSSLVARSVSAINPRAFVFSSPAGKGRVPGFVISGFARGEPFIEIAAEDSQTGDIGFYLVAFDLACTATKNCQPGDLLTPEVEKNWKGWTLYEDEDLKNTIVDCRHCHQPGGTSSKKMLRMQEMKDPWTHWFRNDRPGGVALFVDFLSAHGDQEDYGGIPSAILQKADGLALEDLARGNGGATQPNEFDTKTIEQEVRASAASQPESNIVPGISPTWQAAYDRAARGEAIPVPYHDVKVTDPQKLVGAISAYQSYRAGGPSSLLPDIRKVFLDSALPELTFQPRQGATGREVLVQMCAQCHNPTLDRSISRASFDVTALDAMSASAKERAIARMRMPESELGHMPPGLFRSIPSDALERAIAELSR